MQDFNVKPSVQSTLPISLFLAGYVCGPIVWGPLSETYGRRWILWCTNTCFTLSTLGCALAPSWSTFLGFRFLAGTFASSMITIVPGVYADIFDDPKTRGRAIAVFILASFPFDTVLLGHALMIHRPPSWHHKCHLSFLDLPLQP